jgi:hypothetical protein
VWRAGDGRFILGGGSEIAPYLRQPNRPLSLAGPRVGGAPYFAWIRVRVMVPHWPFF